MFSDFLRYLFSIVENNYTFCCWKCDFIFFCTQKRFSQKKKKKKIGTHDAFWNWLFSLIPYTRQIIISKHVCCIWEHLRSLVVLARSALSISNHKANHYQVFISLRSETDYSLQTASSDNHTHWQTMAGIHHVLQIAYRTERKRTSGRILALYTTHPITIGLNIRHVIDTRKVWFLWNLLRDVYYIYSFNTKYKKMRCQILSVYIKSVLIIVLQSFNR